MKILSLDVGSGDIKVCLYRDGRLDFFKEINAVSKLPPSAYVTPDKSKDLVEFEGNQYLVGESAVRMRSSTQFDTDSFDNIKKLSPIVIKKYMGLVGDCDFYVFDLSIAYLNKAEELLTYISSSLNIGIDKLSLVPQGVGCKMAYQWKGTNINGNASEIINTYMGIDIGFNTIDTFHCIQGKLTSDGVSGKEQFGITKIARELQEFCKSITDIPLALAKEAIITGNLVIKGNPIQGISEKVKELKKKYIEDLMTYLEKEFKDIIDMSEGLIFFGGGAELLRDEFEAIPESRYGKGFISIPQKAEYYNALGNVYYILKREKVV